MILLVSNESIYSCQENENSVEKFASNPCFLQGHGALSLIVEIGLLTEK